MIEQIKCVQMANYEKLNEIQKYFMILQKICSDDVQISFKSNLDKIYPFNDISTIIVSGKFIEFQRCDWLSAISKLADNISVTPYLDGTVDYCLTFYNTLLTVYEGD